MVASCIPRVVGRDKFTWRNPILFPLLLSRNHINSCSLNRGARRVYTLVISVCFNVKLGMIEVLWNGKEIRDHVLNNKVSILYHITHLHLVHGCKLSFIYSTTGSRIWQNWMGEIWYVFFSLFHETIIIMLALLRFLISIFLLQYLHRVHRILDKVGFYFLCYVRFLFVWRGWGLVIFGIKCDNWIRYGTLTSLSKLVKETRRVTQ